jgi:uncharacterized protein (TIGR00645 family)
MYERMKKLMTPTGNPMLAIQTVIERIILYSRYILVVFYVGLAVSLGIYAISFVREIIHVAQMVFISDGDALVMPILHLIDGALVSGLIVMVMLSSYENFVGSFGEEVLEDSPTWLRRLDPGSLKVKVLTALITISGVQLLQVFMDMDDYTDKQILWKVVIHMVFIASAICLALLDRVSGHVPPPSHKESTAPPVPH